MSVRKRVWRNETDIHLDGIPPTAFEVWRISERVHGRHFVTGIQMDREGIAIGLTRGELLNYAFVFLKEFFVSWGAR